MDIGASSYRRYRNGEKEAFDEIIKEYFDKLVFFVDRIVKDTAAAEDIAIDAFSDLIVNPRRYDGRVSFKTYLFMLGRSRALNYLKRRNRFRFVPLTEAETAQTEPQETVFIADEQKRTVNDAIKALPNEMQTVIHLVYFEDLSCEEAAKIMKKTRKQVYNLLYRGKNALRTILEERGRTFENL